MSDVLWELEAVTLAGRDEPRLQGVSLAIHSGFTAVLGWSGAGKTSLLNLLAGFERPTSGRMQRRFDAASSDARLPVFWTPPDGGLWPHLTAAGHLAAVSPVGDASHADSARLLAAFDLEPVRDARPSQLSQGERSRLAVARGLAAGAQVLVMDEPLVHIDPARVGRYRDELIAGCRAARTSLVFSTHAPEAALAAAEWAVCLSGGRAIWHGRVGDLYHRPPSAELATFLGPANWVTAAESELWLGEPAAEDRCHRPERIALEPAGDDGPLRAVASTFGGAVSETELIHVPTGMRRRWVHRSPAATAGTGVRLRAT